MVSVSTANVCALLATGVNRVHRCFQLNLEGRLFSLLKSITIVFLGVIEPNLVIANLARKDVNFATQMGAMFA